MSSDAFEPGQRVDHRSYGRGTVRRVEAIDAANILVEFDSNRGSCIIDARDCVEVSER